MTETVAPRPVVRLGDVLGDAGPYRPSRAVVALLLAVALAGLWLSWRTALALFGLDPDTSHDLLLWQGVSRSGLSWLTDWRFTPDNWLFTLTPLHFLSAPFAGSSVFPFVFEGLLIFVASAFCVGLVVKTAGSWSAAVLSALALVCAGYHAQASGLAAYAMSHNSTNLLGLVSILLSARWIRMRRIWLLALNFGLLLAGSLSDPWMVAAYDIPMAIAAAILTLRPMLPVERKAAFALLLVPIAVLVLTQTQLFGLLGFIPRLTFRLGDWASVSANARIVARELGALMSLVPFYSGDGLAAGLLSLGGALVLFGRLPWEGLKRGGRLPTDQAMILLIAAGSLAGTVAAVLLSREAATAFSTRYMLNVLYVGVALVGLGAARAWPTLPDDGRKLVWTVFVLFVAAGLSSHVVQWRSLAPPPRDTGVAEEIGLLSAYRLTYGYGPYWGARANAVTAASGEAIRLRPVSFDRASGMVIAGGRSETSSRWYRPDDAPPGLKRWFVMVATDDEECSDRVRCVQGARRQFGQPAQQIEGRTVAGNPVTLLVWDHPLLGREAALPVPVGQVVATRAGADFTPALGWSRPEDWGVWSEGETASLRLRPVGALGDEVTLTVDSHAFLAGSKKTGAVTVLINGVRAGEMEYSPAHNAGLRTITFPRKLMDDHKGEILVTFRILSPISPRQAGIGQDDRVLGFGLSSLTVNSKTT